MNDKESPKEEKVDTLSDVIRQSEERRRWYKERHEMHKGKIISNLFVKKDDGQPTSDYDAEIKTITAKIIALNPSYLEEKEQKLEKLREKAHKQFTDSISREIIDDLEKDLTKLQKEAATD